MQNLANKIQQYLKYDKDNRRSRFLAAALSLAVAVSVFASLIMPAISMTDSDEPPVSETFNVPAAYAESNVEGEDFTEYTTDVIVKQKDADADVQNRVTFELLWNIPAGKLTSDNRFFSYELPENFSTENLHTISADILASNVKCGVFNIVEGGNGRYYIEIEFSDRYIKDHPEIDTSGIQGGLDFTADVVRGKDQLKDVTILFPTNKGNTPVDVPFKAKTASIEKSGTKNGDVISWDVTVHNGEADGGGYNDLNGYYLDDTMFGSETLSNVTVTPAGCGSYNSDTHKFEFSSGTTGSGEIHIKYDTPMTLEDKIQDKVVNEAVLTPPDTLEGEIPSTATDTVTYPREVEIQKTGKFDYDQGKTPDGKVDWTITVKNSTGTSLKDAVITDAMLPADKSELTVEGMSADDYTISNGMITITGDVKASELKITYPAEASSTEDNRNKAVLKPDKDSEVSIESDGFLGKYDGYDSLYKSASDGGSGKVTWKISATDYDGFGNAVFTDAMLDYVDDANIGFAIDGGWVNKDELSYTVADGKITLGDSQRFKDAHKVEISYSVDGKTLIDLYKNGNLPGGISVTFDEATGQYLFKNTVSWQDFTQTSEYKYTEPVNEFKKEAKDVVQNEDGTSSIKWQIVFTGSDKGKLSGLEITDTLTAIFNEANAAGLHYMTADQLKPENFDIRFGDDTYNMVNTTTTGYRIDPSAFTVTSVEGSDGKCTKFKVTLPKEYTMNDQYNNPQLLANYKSVVINYWTTADLSGDDIANGDIVKFKNEADPGDAAKPAINEKDITKTDQSLLPYTKFDASGFDMSNPSNSVGSLNTDQNTAKKLADLETVQVVNGADSETYYVFTYGVRFNPEYTLSGKQTISVEDKLPAGFELITDEANKPVCFYWGKNNIGGSWGVSIKSADDTSTANEYIKMVSDSVNADGIRQQVVSFNINNVDVTDSSPTFIYKIRIKKADFEKLLAKNGGSYDVVNAIAGEGKPEYVHKNTITQSALSKYSDTTSRTNGVDYYIDVNPGGVDYDPNNLWLELFDELKINGITDPSEIEVNLNEVRIWELDENLNQVKELTEGLSTTTLYGQTSGDGFAVKFTDAEQLNSEAAAESQIPKTVTTDVGTFHPAVGTSRTNYLNSQTINGYNNTSVSGDFKAGDKLVFNVSGALTDQWGNTTSLNIKTGGWSDLGSIVFSKDGEYSFILSSDSNGLVLQNPTGYGLTVSLDVVQSTDGSIPITAAANAVITANVSNSDGASGRFTYKDSSGNTVDGASWSGNGSYTFKVPAGATSVNFVTDSGKCDVSIKKTETVTETVTNDKSARLKITVPDNKRLRIKYSYGFKREVPLGEGKEDEITVVNNVQSRVSGTPQYAENTATFKIGQNAEGWAVTSPISLAKVDIGDVSIMLTAGFELYRYNPNFTGSDGSHWQPATEINYDTEKNTHQAIKWADTADGKADKLYTDGDTGRCYLQVREPGIGDDEFYVYKLKEIDPPEHYSVVSDGSIYFTYVKSPLDDSYIPQEAVDAGYKQFDSGTKLNVENVRNITLNVKKVWADSSWSDFEYVKCSLYRSIVQSTDGSVPAARELVQVNGEDTFKLTSGESFTITDLPNGNALDGTAYYYYVEELSYKPTGGEEVPISGSKYIPSVKNNGASSDGTTITIVNSSSLKLEKSWIGGKPDSGTKLNIEIYRSTKHELKLPSDAELLGEINLTSADGWKWDSADSAFADKIKSYDSDGNTYYYYAVETNCPEGYTVTSVSATSTGTIYVTNTKNESDNPGGGELPGTGGVGAVPLKVAGAAVCATATVLLVSKRRKSKFDSANNK